MSDCIFCKIVKKEVPSEVISETDTLLVFKNIDPKAPIHWLIVPKEHYDDTRALPDDVWVAIRHEAVGLMEKNAHSGVRLVANVGSSAEINHMHMHYLSGNRDKQNI